MGPMTTVVVLAGVLARGAGSCVVSDSRSPVTGLASCADMAAFSRRLFCHLCCPRETGAILVALWFQENSNPL